jgi:hypothetical protein
LSDPKDKDKPAETSAFLSATVPGYVAAPLLTPEDMAKLSVNDAVRQALLVRAQRNFMDGGGPQAQTGYERELQAEQQKLDSYFSGRGAKDPQAAVILDPIRYDIGRAVGMSSAVTVASLINGANPEDRSLEALPEVKDPNNPEALGVSRTSPLFFRSMGYDPEGIGKQMETPFVSRFGTTYTQFPTENPNNLVQGGVITPASEKLDPTRVPGLSYADNLTYINWHEMWHARDTREAVFPANFNADLPIKSQPNDPATFKACATRNQQESFADVGSVGDMIRSGKPMSVLDAVLDWRRVPEDTAHTTVPALEGLKQKIQEMGLDKFRKLDDAQAQALYEKVVDEKALNAEDVRIIHDEHSWNPLKSLPVTVKSFTDPETKKALGFERQQTDDALGTLWRAVKGTAPIPFDPQMPPALAGWNPTQVLEDTAFAAAHKITPETMSEAYVKLQDKLESQARAAQDPAQAQIYAAQMTMLQTAFVRDVQSLDYLKLNQDRGVNLAAVEPDLKPVFQHFDAQPPSAPKPAKPPATPPKAA